MTSPISNPGARAAKAKPNPPRYLRLQGTPVEKAPVKIVAMYSGDIGPGVFEEFKRRYQRPRKAPAFRRGDIRGRGASR